MRIAPPAAINFTVTDVDNEDGSLEVTAVTSNGDVIPVEVGNIDLGGSGSARTVTVTPLADKNTWNAETSTDEPVTVTLTVSDGSLTDSDTFTVSVTKDNDTPEPEDDGYIEGDEITVAEDGTIVIDVLANDYDVDRDNEGDSLVIHSVSGVDNASVGIINGGTELHFTPDLDYFGVEEFTYTVADEGGKTATANVKVTVTEVKRSADHFGYSKPDYH